LGKDFLSYTPQKTKTDPPPVPGLTWQADVTLVGPGNNLGVDKIMVGFVQHVEFTARQVTFQSGKILVSSVQSTTDK
jgi:hypothetical protein